MARGLSGWLRCAAAATALLALFALAGATNQDWAPVSGSRERTAWEQTAAALEERVPELIEASGVPGLAIALIDGGEVVWTGAFGVMNAESGAPVRETTVFEAASLSKPVFAYAVLRMVDRGELSLDEPLWNTLEYERLSGEERARSMTPRMVLTHTTGLPNWGGTPLELEFDPGSAWQYSGEGFVFLQKAVEAKTGFTVEEIVAREVFGPLGLTHSHYVWVSEYDSLAATPHDELGLTAPKSRPDEGNAAATLHTTAGDYARFLAAVVTGEGLSPQMHAEMLRPHTDVTSAVWGEAEEPKRHVFWGLGWGIQDGDNADAVWHWGDNMTSRCFVVAYPAEGRGLVYFTNSEAGLSIAEDIASVFTDDEPWGLRWLDYPRHDDMSHQAALRVRRAFLEEGVAEGERVYRLTSNQFPGLLDEEAVNGLGYYLLRRDRVHEAIWVLRENALTHGTSSNVWDSLGEAHMTAGEYGQAIESYRVALELDPSNESAQRHIDWMEFEVAALDNLVTLTEAELARFAGFYGPRQVTFRDGRLHYLREDTGVPERELQALTADVFVIPDVPYVRFRFESDEQGNVVAMVGLYLDGRTDRHPRDP
jgi:CubicO group peptidase (beta-lactamase class C family)